MQKKSEEKGWFHVVAGAGAAWTTAIVTCPLDVVKTRLQTSKFGTTEHRVSFPTFNLLLNIWKQEGVRGMYRGLGPTLVGYLPAYSIYFPTYNFLKGLISQRRRKSVTNDSFSHLMAAILAGAFGNLCTNPLWVVRTRLMTQHVLGDQLYSGSFDAFKSIYKQEGIKGFYKGAVASIAGVLHVAVQFPLYEWLKRVLNSDQRSQHPSTINIILSSTISKLIASTITYPHETIRTRLQVQRHTKIQYYGILDVIKKVWSTEGFAGYYRGLSTNILRVIPASAVTFLTYETIIKYLSKS